MKNRKIGWSKFFVFGFLVLLILTIFSCKGKVEERRDITITHIAVNPRDSRIIYTTTDGMGVLKSVDGGREWDLINHGLKNLRVHFLAIDPFDSNIIYIGTHGAGVYKSEDSGVSWAEINEGLTNTTVTGITINPSDSNVLYLLTMHGGIFKSSNKGKSWTSFNEGLTQPEKNLFICLLFFPSLPDRQIGNPPTLYLGSLKGMFKRSTGDNHWVPQNELTGLVITSLAYDSKKGILYANVGNPGKLFKSNDKGITWFSVSEELRGAIESLVVDPSKSELYAAIYSIGVLKSADEGISWKEINRGLSSKDVEVIVSDPQHSGTLYTGLWGGGVFITTNGGKKWLSLNERFPRGLTIDLSSLLRAPDNIHKDIQPPEGFSKCNVCHGWTDPLLNLRKSVWLVTPTPRDWELTVKRMNALYQQTTGESTKAALTEAEEVNVAEFLNKYYGIEK